MTRLLRWIGLVLVAGALVGVSPALAEGTLMADDEGIRTLPATMDLHLTPCTAETQCPPAELANFEASCLCDQSGEVAMVQWTNEGGHLLTFLLDPEATTIDPNAFELFDHEAPRPEGVMDWYGNLVLETSPLDRHPLCDILRLARGTACIEANPDLVLRYHLYDKKGRLLTTVEDYCADGWVDQRIDYAYDLASNRVAVDLDVCADGYIDRVCEYAMPNPAPYDNEVVRCLLMLPPLPALF